MDNNFCTKLKQFMAKGPLKLENDTDYYNSAVLVPLIEQAGKLAVLFEVRSSELTWQPGEICFPGGRIEAGDGNPMAAAIRETSEELGVATNLITPLGALDYVVSQIGVLVYPHVGFIAANTTKLNLSQAEVSEVFTVPLDYLLTAEPTIGHMQLATRPLDDVPLSLLGDGYPRDWKARKTYPILFYQYDGHVIWGLTARILAGFLNVCREVIKE